MDQNQFQMPQQSQPPQQPNQMPSQQINGQSQYYNNPNLNQYNQNQQSQQNQSQFYQQNPYQQSAPNSAVNNLEQPKTNHRKNAIIWIAILAALSILSVTFAVSIVIFA